MIKQEEFYGVTVDLVGQTKVTGSSYLTDSLASAVLSRQLEKDHSGVAKFLPDRIHFSRTTSGKMRIYRREVPYNDVLKIYVFPNKPDIFMLCTEGDYEGGRLYQSFRCHNAMDLQTVRRMIYGDANFTARSQIVGGDYYVDRRPGSAVYVEAPRPVTYVKEYLPPPRSPSPTYVERIQTVQRERTPSPVPVRRVSVVQKAVPSPQTVYVQRAQEPVVVRRVRPAEPVVAETVQVQREPSPMFVRRASYVSRPASVVYVEDSPAVEESVSVRRVITQRAPSPVIIRQKQTVTRVITPPPAPPALHRRASQTYVTEYVEPTVTETIVERSPLAYRRSSLIDLVDDGGRMILRRVTRVNPTL